MRLSGLLILSHARDTKNAFITGVEKALHLSTSRLVSSSQSDNGSADQERQKAQNRTGQNKC